MLNLWKLTGQIKTGSPFPELLREMAAPESAFIKLILINSVAISFLSLVIPISVQSILTNLGILNVAQPIIVMSLALFIILIFSGAIQMLQFHAIEVLRRRLFLRYGAVILNKVTNYLDTHFQSVHRPQLAKRYTDVLLAQASMVIFFVDGIGFAIQYIISMGLLFLYHPYFLAFGVILTAMLFFSWKLFGPKGVDAGTPEADTRYEAMGWIDEVLRIRPLFMSTRGRQFAEEKFVDLLEKWNLRRENLYRQQFWQALSLQLINAFVYAVLLGVGYMLVKKGELSVGQLVAAAIVTTMLLSALPRLQNFFISVYDYSTNLDKLAEFWSHPEERQLLTEGTHDFPPGALDVNFQKATYDEGVEFDFNVNAGERVYFYVRSYTAVRTLLKTMQGFLHPSSGEIRIAGQRWDNLDFGILRDNIAIIGEGRFFTASVRENLIALAPFSSSVTEIEDALEKVGLLDTIKALPEGLETVLLPNGYPLSISETLALQVARVLVTRPGIILVTSDFDKMSHFKRRAAEEVLLNRNNDWTVLFFTQRILKGKFDRYHVLDRKHLKQIPDAKSAVEEAEKYE